MLTAYFSAFVFGVSGTYRSFARYCEPLVGFGLATALDPRALSLSFPEVGTNGTFGSRNVGGRMGVLCAFKNARQDVQPAILPTWAGDVWIECWDHVTQISGLVKPFRSAESIN